MGLRETDCASLTSLPCRHEDSWTLKLVNPITGKTIHECPVTDESDWLQIRRDAYSLAPKANLAKSNIWWVRTMWDNLVVTLWLFKALTPSTSNLI